VVPFAKKKRKGYRDDPPDEEAADGLVEEWEEDEEVEEGEDFHDDDEGNNGFRELQFQCCLFFAMMMMIGTWEFRVLSALGRGWLPQEVCISDLFLGSPCLSVLTGMRYANSFPSFQRKILRCSCIAYCWHPQTLRN